MHYSPVSYSHFNYVILSPLLVNQYYNTQQGGYCTAHTVCYELD